MSPAGPGATHPAAGPPRAATPELRDAPPLASALLLVVVAVAGAATMTVELSAVRLLAPWFGASAGVWTNVIGVVLLALALGYLLGARLSGGPHPERRLALALALAAVVAATLPPLAGPVARTFMPSGVPLHEAAQLLVWGSLASTAVLFLPAALLLGAVGPLAVEVLQRARGGGAGLAGGRILAVSTVGSLLGTFGTTHVFLPTLGVRMTFLAAAATLLVAAAVVGLALRRPLPAGLGALALAAVAPLGYSPPGAGEGEVELAAVDSAYQRLRVLEVDGDAGPMRVLRVNESLDSFQSVWVPEPGLLPPPGMYYDHFALPVALDERLRAGELDRWRVLVVGLGAGTTLRVLEGVLPEGVELDAVGVEIDPEVLALGERYFELEPGPGRVLVGGLDGRAALALAQGSFDQVVLDAYANNMEIPAHLATVEFFREVAAVLRPGGWISANVGGFGLDDPVVEAVARSAAAGTGARVHAARVPFSRNVSLHARREAAVPEPGGESWSFAPALEVLRGPLELPGTWAVFEPDSAGPLTDDRSPLEWLQLRSIEEAAARWASRS